MENGKQLYNIGCHCTDGELNVYVLHVIDEVVEIVVPAGYLCGLEITQDSSDSINKSSKATAEGSPNNINTKQPLKEPSLKESQAGISVDDFSAEEPNVGAIEDVIVEEDGSLIAEDEVINKEEGVESDVASSESDVDEILDEDDSEVDEELRVIKNDRRNKKKASRRKKQPEAAGVPIGEAGTDR
ncbi:hypothetical protein A4A49_39843, partial [Nicotiana attenuata]